MSKTKFILFPSSPNLFFFPAIKATKPGDTHEPSLSQTPSHQPWSPTYSAPSTPVESSSLPSTLSQVLFLDEGQSISLSTSSFFPSPPPTIASRLSSLQVHLYFTICTPTNLLSLSSKYTLPCHSSRYWSWTQVTISLLWGSKVSALSVEALEGDCKTRVLSSWLQSSSSYQALPVASLSTGHSFASGALEIREANPPTSCTPTLTDGFGSPAQPVFPLWTSLPSPGPH